MQDGKDCVSGEEGGHVSSPMLETLPADDEATEPKRPPLRINLEKLGFWRVSIVLAMLGAVVLWILCTIKFAIDGSLPARLALWGFLPEAYAAISVRAVCGLLRLKKNTTPCILLRNCVTDAGAQELAEAVRLYDGTADVQALELPHNPQLGQAGLRALVAMCVREGSNIQEVDFSYNFQLGRYLIPEIRPLLPSKTSKITVLRLADCGIGAADVQKLAESLTGAGVRTLDLSMNALGGAGESLGSVCEAPMLEELLLARCGLRPGDVSAVAEQLQYTSIKSIQLGGNRFGAAGLKALVEFLASTQVQEVGLEANDLEAKDLSTLGESWAKRPFARVRLTGNRLSNEEIATFVKTLKSLQA